MSRMTTARALGAAAVVLACVAGLSAQQPDAPGTAADVHGAAGHAEAHAAPHGGPEGAGSHFLTVNVALADGRIQPSSVFVPAGQPVQLMLRNRGTTEHHYHVLGLTPEELWWGAEGASADTAQADGGDDAHDHHGRAFTTTRATSPAGITPTGRDVHGYVSPARVVDMVLFTAAEPGTFAVRCDLHAGETATLTVFPAAEPQAAPLAGASGQALRVALTRDLGRVDYPGAAGVRVEATYAPAEYERQLLGGAPALDAGPRGGHIAVLLTEQLHTANLPPSAVAPALHVDGAPVPLLGAHVVTDSVHHRAIAYRFARDEMFGQGHQVMTLRLPSGQEATWHLPLVLPAFSAAGAAAAGFTDQWGLVLALLGGMLAAMWPCLFQLTVYFIPALAGVAMQEGGAAGGRRIQVLHAAFFFILGFTLVYTATGAVIGYAAQRFGDTSQFEAWQRYIGIGAGVIVIGLALRVAAKVRAPLVCRMPLLSRMAHAGKPAGRMEMMVAGLAFATGCMTCFGSALVVGMVVYIGLAQSALYGALVLFLFSLGMGIPLVIAAVAMSRALPLLMKLERAVPWMGLVSACLMGGFGVLLVSGNYMMVSEWTYRLAAGATSLPYGGSAAAGLVVIVATLGAFGWLAWKARVPKIQTG